MDYLQAIRVHGLASVELEILETGQQLLLNIGLGTLLELGNFLGRGTILLELALNSLHVTFTKIIPLALD